MENLNQDNELIKMKQQNEILIYAEHYLDNTHTSIARLLRYLYNKNYCVTTDGNKDKWFRFNGRYWESSNGIKHELKNKLSSEVTQIVADTRAKIREKIMSVGDENKTYWEKERLKTLLYIERNLYNTHFKDGVIKECESIFYQEKLPDVN